MSERIQRYEIYTRRDGDLYYADNRPCEQGEYVRYKNHAKYVEKLETELAECKAERDIARRLVCEIQAVCELGFDAGTTQEQVAKYHKWDCFEKEATDE